MNFRLAIDGQKPIEGVFNAAQPFTPPIITHRVAIVSNLPDHFADPLAIEVNSTKLHDSLHPAKGDTITVYPSTLRHMQRIQTESAYKWTVRPWMLWTNMRYVGDPFGEPWTDENGDPIKEHLTAECITGYGNFVEILDEIGEYYEIRATPTDADLWDTFGANFNWFNYPCLWVKQSARNKKTPPDIFNVGTAYDAYFPVLKETPKLYILKSNVELLPPSPDGGYILQGMSVYTAGMKPLRLARKPGELIYPTSWRINTAGVIPAAVT